MIIDGEILMDGMGMISYLDRKLQQNVSEGLVTTGIIISSAVRKELTRACQRTLNMTPNHIETVNRFRNVLLIEDGMNEDRLEVVSGRGIVVPQEGNAFMDLKKIGRR
jgi:hypothetical protein